VQEPEKPLERKEEVSMTHEPREGVPRNGAEQETLIAMLDWLRMALYDKLDGVEEEAARRRLVPSETTLLGLVKHTAIVEATWFRYRFLGEEDPYGEDEGFELDDSDDVTSVLALYRTECDKSRAAIREAAPDDPAARDLNGRTYNLRYILIHMIEETARHAGHADILREQIDGSTGE
jgi:uncharacterized damage-inducible protein DinB